MEVEDECASGARVAPRGVVRIRESALRAEEAGS